VRPLAIALTSLAGLAVAGPGRAQISPGKLSRSHAALEGSDQCLKCHEAKQGVSSDKCLACHVALKARLAASQGLHARPDYHDCKKCHVEHQGLEYDLVWWGKAGRQAFDHQLTGYALAGPHARLTCDRCHAAQHQKDRAALGRQGVNLERTFLGLGTACQECHRDEHRGQFGPKGCGDCHDQKAWKPAPGFRHDRTEFALTGRHAGVACERCHKTLEADAAGTFRRFRGAAMPRECAACHQDPHAGRLGAACATCHESGGWTRVQTGRFDHERTAYPLRGRHAAVPCDRCHVPGKPLRLRHELCTDCHADAHLGQLAARPDHGRCEACHDVGGFVPVHFSVENHQRTAYPLAGAHLAVACTACHRLVAGREPGAAGARLAASNRDQRAVRLHFASQRCADCHRDPHQGEVDRWIKRGGCEVCHRVSSWHEVAFDHGQTKYPLAGGHAKPACKACHKKLDPGTKRERIRFPGLSQACGDCHQDPHRGQFARDGITACDRCHSMDSLRAARFDHGRDTRFALKGAHARKACSVCHLPVIEAGVSFVRYKPLPTACKDCHKSWRRPADAETR
jgi:hypothetical protein